jgi:hypothetical protein
MRSLSLLLLLLSTTISPAAETSPIQGSNPIAEVKREIYREHPRPKTSVWAAAHYVGPGLLREERCSTMARSDTPKKPKRRWSKDNGRTWSEYEPMPEFVTNPQGLRIVWCPMSYFHDAEHGVLMSVWLRQATLKKRHGKKTRKVGGNQTFSRISRDLGRTWSEPRQMTYEPGAVFDPKKPLDPEYLNYNPAYAGNNVIRHSNGTLVHAVCSVNINEDISVLNPKGVSAWHAPPDVRCIGSLCFIGRWDDQLGDYRWEPGKPVWVTRSVSSRGLIEPEVAELKDGRVLVVWRAANDRLDPKEMPGYKLFSVSTDGGKTLSPPKPWTYEDGTPFFSPSAIHRMIRHSVTGKLYWIGNISPRPVRGNSPRYPLVIAEVNEEIPALKRDTVTIIDDRRPEDSAKLQLSNFSLLEDREDHTLEVYLTRLGEDPKDFWGANAYKYTLRLR